ncbi:MAG: OmpA family protein [Paracoccaceae bacterium]
MTRAPALLAAAAIAGLALSGCQSTGTNTVTGAVLGAGTGAALGTLAGGDDRRNALVGAGIGLLAGATVGNYLDAQEQALRTNLAGTGASVTNTGSQLVVILPGNVTFATDSAQIQPQFVPTLNNVTNTLNQYPQSFIDVIGHTDSTGDANYNLGLSERRAQSVADFFRVRGIYVGRIAAFGLGETQPIADNGTNFGRAQNRRVELVIIPAQDG